MTSNTTQFILHARMKSHIERIKYSRFAKYLVNDESHPVEHILRKCVCVCGILFVCWLKLKHSFFILFFRIWCEHYYKVLFSIQSHFIWKMNRNLWVSECFFFEECYLIAIAIPNFIVFLYSSLLLSIFVAFLRISVDR